MVDPVRIRRDDFVAQLSTAKLDVNTLTGDSRMLNVDVAAADLDQDGKIAGATEVGALFDEVDRLDNDGSALTTMLAGSNGRATATAAPMAAIGDLGNAPIIQNRANEALPGISVNPGSGRGPTTGVFANRSPFGVGGQFGPSAQQVAREIQVQTIRNRVGHELQQDPPDYTKVLAEMKKLGKDEAADFVRSLRINHPELYQKLGTQVKTDADTRATFLADEPALTERVVKRQAKVLGRIPDREGSNATLDYVRSIPKIDRPAVLREIERTDPRGLRDLQQICRDTQDPNLIDMFKRAGVRP